MKRRAIYESRSASPKTAQIVIHSIPRAWRRLSRRCAASRTMLLVALLHAYANPRTSGRSGAAEAPRRTSWSRVVESRQVPSMNGPARRRQRLCPPIVDRYARGCRARCANAASQRPVNHAVRTVGRFADFAREYPVRIVESGRRPRADAAMVGGEEGRATGHPFDMGGTTASWAPSTTASRRSPLFRGRPRSLS